MLGSEGHAPDQIDFSASKRGQKSNPFPYKPLKYDGGECTEIRLLTLDPGTMHSEVRATLAHASFDQPPPYEALSYVWGNPMLEENGTSTKAKKHNECRFVRLNGHSFAVGDNLHSALQHLRHELEPRYLWIDAVCIDQNNIYERGRQVRIMDQIFAKSSSVLAWLGEADEDSGEALNAIEDICWAVKVRLWGLCAIELGIPLKDVSIQLIKNLERPIFDEDEGAISGPFVGLFESVITKLMAWLEKVDVHIPLDAQSMRSIAASSSKYMTPLREQLLSTDPIDMEIPSLKVTFQSLRRFFSHRSYWNRLWIVQELFFAPRVQLICGSSCLDLDKLKLIEQIRHSFRFRRPDASSAAMLHFAGQAFNESLWTEIASDIIRIAGGFDRRFRLSTNILDFTDRSCTEPVDRIFALLGMSEAIKITPDYEKPPAEIFMATTKAIIEQEQSLNILCFATGPRMLGRSSYHELPSFVPQYEAVFEYPRLIYPYALRQDPWQLYRSGGALLSAYFPNRSSFETEHSLAISGCFWGSIAYKWRTECVDRGIMSPQDWDVFYKFYVDLFDSLGLAADRDNRNSTSRGWKTLFGDCYPTSSTRVDSIRMSKHNKAEAQFVADLYEALEQNNPSYPFLVEVFSSMGGQALYQTDRGDLVRASNKVMVGDDVFVARGLSCAMIVRQVSEAKAMEAASEAARAKIQIREFVAGAYVEGIMDGEAIKKVDDGEIEEMQVLLI